MTVAEGSIRSSRTKGKSKGITTPLAEALEGRLYSYALLAAGAAVSLLPAAANAEVIYTPADVAITRGTLLIDLNGDSVSDFIVADQFLTVPRSSFPILGKRKLGLRGDSGAGVMASNHGAAVLGNGVTIGSSRTFVDAHQNKLLMLGGQSVYVGSTGTCCFFAYGNWKDVQQQYLGLKFTINGETHYGWARFTVKLPVEVTAPIKAILSGYAYESNPGQSIVAGDTGSNAGTLGTLARGAAHQ
jgi:hypothetical protein